MNKLLTATKPQLHCHLATEENVSFPEIFECYCQLLFVTLFFATGTHL